MNLRRKNKGNDKQSGFLRRFIAGITEAFLIQVLIFAIVVGAIAFWLS